jgi:hypothetical protein
MVDLDQERVVAMLNESLATELVCTLRDQFHDKSHP